jgi:UPF0755 protein
VIQGLVHSLKFVTIIATAILVAVGGRSFFDYYTAKEADPRLGQPFTLTIGEDDDADSLAGTLSEAGLIRSELVFETEMRLTSDVIQPGVYTLRRGMSVGEIVDVITISPDDDADDGERTEARLVEMRSEEGWRIEQIAAAYADLGMEGGYEAFVAATGNISTRRYDFLDDRPDGAGLEGFLFPDTYSFGSNARPEDVIYYMLDTFNAKLTPQMRETAEELGLSIYEVVTLASIVEREAGSEEERKIIAAVYLNRLEEGMPLQADPTVVYAIGDEDNWWPELQPDQAEEVDSSYNTYLHDGLPPGPICNPSIASIKAVLDPDDVDYLYFVATGDGETHLFATTYEEHLANIEEVEGR